MVTLLLGHTTFGREPGYQEHGSGSRWIPPVARDDLVLEHG